jgi:hypothetical protein
MSFKTRTHCAVGSLNHVWSAVIASAAMQSTFFFVQRDGLLRFGGDLAAGLRSLKIESELARKPDAHFPGQDGLRFSPNALRPSLASSVIASNAIWLSV